MTATYTKAQMERMKRWVARWCALCLDDAPRSRRWRLRARAFCFWVDRTDPGVALGVALGNSDAP